MNYLLKIKNFTVNCMIENELLAEEIQDEYYKLLIKVGENKYSQRDFRKYHSTIQNILKVNDKVSWKN